MRKNEVDFHTSRPLQVREVNSGAAVYNETEPPADRVGVLGTEPHWYRAHGEISGRATWRQRSTVGRFDQPARAGALDPTDAADEAEAGREMDCNVGAVAVVGLLAGATVTVTVATAVPLPSVTRYVNVVTPGQSAGGVYVMVCPPVSTTAVPCAGACTTAATVRASLSASVSLSSTEIVTVLSVQS